MIYSRSAEYAIRAFVHLAQVPESKYAMVKNIADQEEIPAHFLAKILQQLARKGLLRSSKGPTGGFALKVDPSEIRLLDIVEALDGLAPYQECASGLSECNDEMPAACPVAGRPSGPLTRNIRGRTRSAACQRPWTRKRSCLLVRSRTKPRLTLPPNAG